MSGADLGPIAVVVGTRPEAIKLVPVVTALREAGALRPKVLTTGQHVEMVAEVLGASGIEVDRACALRREGGSLAGLAAPLVAELAPTIDDLDPSAVVVQGDTTSALVAGLVAHWAGVPVVHLEAGLRTGDLARPFPEEGNRRGLTAIASLHLAPTHAAAGNLAREGISDATVVVTGNTVVDAIVSAVGRRRLTDGRAVAGSDGPVLVTLHRREVWGEPLAGLVAAVAELATRHPARSFVVPVHPGAAVSGTVRAGLAGIPNVRLTGSLPYRDAVSAIAGARLVITDSGGIQEESVALGVPVLVVRDRTERPEGITAGGARLVGTDGSRLVVQATEMLEDDRAWAEMVDAPNPYGDGHAGRRAAQAIAWRLGLAARPADIPDPGATRRLAAAGVAD